MPDKQRDPREWCFAKRYYNLTIKQWKFAMLYVGECNFDSTQAILRSYGNEKPFACDEFTVPEEQRNTMTYVAAKSMGSQNLAKVNIQECISDLLQVTSMPKDEVLNRISKMARGDVGDVIQIDASGKPTIDLKKAKEKGALYLIKKLNFDSMGNLKSIEMHDSFAALVKLGQHHKLFDRQAEQPVDPRVLARELLEELRFKYEDRLPETVIMQKVIERFGSQGVTEHDLIEAPDNNN